MDQARRNSIETAIIVTALSAAAITWWLAIRNVGTTAASVGIAAMVAFAYWRFLRGSVALYFAFRQRIGRMREKRSESKEI